MSVKFAAPREELTEDAGRAVSRYSPIWCLGVAFALFQLYTGVFGPFPNLEQRSIHVGFGLALVFLLDFHQQRGTLSRAVSLSLGIAAVVACANIVINVDQIVLDPFGRLTTTNVALGLILLLALAEASRRKIGLIFVLVVSLSVLYALFGWVLPGKFGHPGYDVPTIVDVAYLTTEGMWGMITGISAAEIAMFIIFGALLSAVGGGEIFFKLALVLAGRLRGGAAQVATVASSLFGMINGSSAANAATTGALTIPMMKRQGYPAALAAAVEATASTGGQLMPPIMGVVAFLMAELTGVPYITIALAAVIPSVIYYLNIMVGIHFLAAAEGLDPVPESERPKAEDLLNLRELASLILPVGLILYLLVTGRSALFAGTWGTVSVIAFYVVFGGSKPATIPERLSNVLAGLYDAGKAMAYLAILSPAANLIMGMVGFTGIGLKFTAAVLAVGESSPFLALVLGGAVSLILGMGMPTAGAYLLAAAVVVPSLVSLGFETIPAHFFIFYFSIIAAITPPVCATLYVTCAMAGARWEPASYYAIRLALAGFIVPFVIIYAPDILLGQGSWGWGLVVSASTMCGIVSLAAAVFGQLLAPLRYWQRGLLAVAGAAMIDPGVLTDMIGIAGLASVVAWQSIERIGTRRKAARLHAGS